MTHNKRKRDIGYILMVAITISVILFAHFFNRIPEDPLGEGLSYESGWTYFDGERYADIKEFPTNIEWEAGRELVLHNELPKTDTTYNALVFRSTNQNVKVYVGGRQIYTFGTNEKRQFGKTPGSVWNYVVLPEDCAGQDIQIRLSSGYQDEAGFISTFKLGQYDKMQSSFIRGKLLQILISVITLVYGVVMIVVQGILSRYTRKAKGYLYLGMFSITVGAWAFLETQIVQFVYAKTSVLSLVAFYALMHVPVTFIKFLEKMYFEEGSILCKIINYAGCINIGVQTILQVLNIRDVYEMVWVTHILILLTVVVGISKVIARYIKTKNREYGNLAIAFSVLGVTGIIDVVRYYVLDFGDNAKYFRIGILTFIVLVSIWYTGKVIERLKMGFRAQVYENMAQEDALTKCKNRSYFESELKTLDTHHKKYKQVAIIIFDVGNLKYYNHTYGNSIGDLLLSKGAYCISSAFKEMGEPARVGGDEFAIILKNRSVENIESALEIMNEKAEYFSENSEYNLKITHGCAQYDSLVDDNMESVFVRADKDLQEKKKQIRAASVE